MLQLPDEIVFDDDELGGVVQQAAEDLDEDPGGEDLTDQYPNARRCGAYWDTPYYRSAIALEAAVFRFLRELVDAGRARLDDLPVVIGKICRGFSLGEEARRRSYNDPLFLLNDFLKEARRQFRWAVMNAHAEEILRQATDASRRGRELWNEQPYWPPALEKPTRVEVAA